MAFTGFLIGTGVLLAAVAAAQDAATYPSKAIRVVSPYTPGAQSDTVMRAVGQKLTEKWGQPLVIDNKPGAAGNIGAEMVARSTPDGYTLLLADGALFTVNPTLFRNLPFDPLRDFAPITRLNLFASVLVVHPSIPASSVADFVALAKAKPGSLTYGTAGVGAGSHLNMEVFKLMQGINVTAVHYKGSAPMQLDLTAGRLSSTLLSVFSSAPMAKSGKWRVLGYAHGKRSPLLPDVPTFAEAGFPGFEASSWFCMAAPAGTPRTIVAKLQQEIARVLKDPAFTEQVLTSRGLEPVGDTPEELTALIRAEIPKWAKLIKAAGITLD